MITMRSKVVLAGAIFVGVASTADAVHFFRGNETGGCLASFGGTCCPQSGNVTDDPIGGSGTVAATVQVLHNTFNDGVTQLPLVVIQVGQAVRWDWSSSHCHSVTSDTGAFDSGFLYPTDAPEGQSVFISGVFDYPFPDTTPALSYTHTFAAPGVYPYHCVHHQVIGMEGVVIVTP